MNESTGICIGETIKFQSPKLYYVTQYQSVMSVTIRFIVPFSSTDCGRLLQRPSNKLSAHTQSNSPIANPGHFNPLQNSPRRDTLFLMMSISFGGLGLMSIRRPFSELAAIVLGKGDIQSMFCVVVFCIVFFVLG